MQLLYTNSTKFNKPQEDASKSLGGFISSSEVQDQLIGNIFGDLSKYGIYNNLNKGEYRCIAIKNDGTTTLTGLDVFFSYPDESQSDSNTDLFATFQLAFEDPQVDDCGDLFLSKITSFYAKPSNIDFVSIDGNMNALSLPDLAPGQYLGIWIKRMINKTAQQQLTDQQYLDIMNGVLVLPQLEEINLNFVWN
jgi:hypothetical protein